MDDRKSTLGTYYCFFPVRDGEKTIGSVMESLVGQSYPPLRIIIVNDGSTDSTETILNRFKEKYGDLIEIINTGNKTRDYKRIPQLWNMCLRSNFDYHMIAAGDVSFVPNYAEKIIGAMQNDPELVICSGDYGEGRAKTPHGAGRFVRQSFFYKHYQKYPEIVGYESEILERALMKRQKLNVIHELKFEHLDRLGHSHNFSEFGFAMKSLGYYPPYVAARFLIDFLYNKNIGKMGALRMLRYYLFFQPTKTGYYSKFPSDVRESIRQRQKTLIMFHLKQRFKKYLFKTNSEFVPEVDRSILS